MFGNVGVFLYKSTTIQSLRVKVFYVSSFGSKNRLSRDDFFNFCVSPTEVLNRKRGEEVVDFYSYRLWWFPPSMGTHLSFITHMF